MDKRKGKVDDQGRIKMIFELSYKLISLSPLCPGRGSSMGAIHRQVLLDSSGFPLIKGSTVKGTMRYHLTKVLKSWSSPRREVFQFSLPHYPHDLYPPSQSPSKVKPDPIAAIFGTKQMPGQLFFSDARLDRESCPDPTYFPLDVRSCTAINRKLGVVRHNHLYTMELIPTGSIFRGRIFGQGNSGAFFPDIDEKDPLCLVPLLLGLRLITHIGGGKSRGLGACKFETEKLTVNHEPWDMKDLSSLKDLWEQFINIFPLRWDEEQGRISE